MNSCVKVTWSDCWVCCHCGEWKILQLFANWRLNVPQFYLFDNLLLWVLCKKKKAIARACKKWHHNRDLPQTYLHETIKFGSYLFQDWWKLFNPFCQCKDRDIKMYNLKVCLREKAFHWELVTISSSLGGGDGSWVLGVYCAVVKVRNILSRTMWNPYIKWLSQLHEELILDSYLIVLMQKMSTNDAQ